MGFFSNLFSGVSGQAIGGSVIGSAVNSGLGLISSSIQNSMQQKNARYWADYNSPKQQMERLREAGLNPNLVYGNGATASYDGNQGVSAPSMGFSSDSLSHYTALANANLQRDSLRADIANKEADVANKQADVELKQQQKENLIETNQNLKKEGSRLEAQTGLLLSQKDLVEVQKNMSRLTYELESKYGYRQYEAKTLTSEAEAAIKGVESKYADTMAQLKVRLGNAQANELISKVAVASAQIANYLAQAAHSKALAQVAEDEHNLFEVKRCRLSFETSLEHAKLLESDMRNQLRQRGLWNPENQGVSFNEAMLHQSSDGLSKATRVFGKFMDGMNNYVNPTVKAVGGAVSIIK